MNACFKWQEFNTAYSSELLQQFIFSLKFFLFAS